jgi:ketosteroid isomerase-like protein
MKILIGSVFAFLICAFCVFPQHEKQTMEQTVKTIDRELSAAIMKGDVATVDRILAEDYVEVTAQGVLQNKADIMAFVRTRAAAPKAISVGPEISLQETKLSVYGDIAVWVGLRITKYQHMDYQVAPGSGQLPPPDITNRERFMKVYVRRAGRWQMVASQTTNVTAAPGTPPKQSEKN